MQTALPTCAVCVAWPDRLGGKAKQEAKCDLTISLEDIDVPWVEMKAVRENEESEYMTMQQLEYERLSRVHSKDKHDKHNKSEGTKGSLCGNYSLNVELN